jgi:hypothetical protein
MIELLTQAKTVAHSIHRLCGIAVVCVVHHDCNVVTQCVSILEKYEGIISHEK